MLRATCAVKVGCGYCAVYCGYFHSLNLYIFVYVKLGNTEILVEIGQL